ncbi:hypothetical protein JTB14_029388 [Gonioctena quinquepunctata]|nr:hypothetical protein JTB14_029388 [Gonioctena quinquepunctata]
MNQPRVTSSSSDKEMLTIAEEELSRLCRQLRIMEDDRIAFLDETRSKLEKQRKIIHTLKKEKERITEDITISNCSNQKRSDDKLSKTIYKLLEDFQRYDACVKNEKEHLSELEIQMKKICRICLEKVHENVEVLGNLIIKMLEILPVHIDACISRSPVICSACCVKLQKSFESKMTCLGQDDYLKTYLISATKVVNLQEIISNTNTSAIIIKKEHENICRFCLKYYLIECLTFLNNSQDWFLKDMIDRCFPEIDLGVSADPFICNNCIESLQHQFNFMAQCCDSEELIKNYMSSENIASNNQIDLHNVYEYTLKTKSDFEKSIDFIKQERETYNTPVESEPDDEFHEEMGLKVCKAEMKNIKTESTYRGCGFTSRLQPNKTDTDFACSHCPYKTNRRDSLVSHLLVHKNTEIKIYNCDFCSFQTKWRTSLAPHMLRHKKLTELTMYKCNDCPYQSKYKKHLRRHMKTHSKVGVYFCQFCRCRSKRRSYIDNHKCKYDRVKMEIKTEPVEVKVEPLDMTIGVQDLVPEVTADDPSFTKVIEPSKQCWWYKCNTCSYETKKSHHMKEHIVKHLGKDEVELHECGLCKFKTKYRASLSHHMKQIHRKKKDVVE